MASRYIFLVLSFEYLLVSVYGHGMVIDPPNRSSAWRYGFNTPVNYNDNANRCGGVSNEHGSRDINCGVCGDDPRLRQLPRPNEDGGKYGTGTIVREYKEGAVIPVKVEITASHMGKFTFSLCNLDKGYETEKCFERYPLTLADGRSDYEITPQANFPRTHHIDLQLPRGLTCQRCVLRWQYIAGNNWGYCKDSYGRRTSYGRLGCGRQETFRTCSDIRIVSKRVNGYDDYNYYNYNYYDYNNNDLYNVEPSYVIQS